MILATYIDGRSLAYDEGRYQFFLAGSPVSLSEVRGWDAAGQLQWRSDAQHDWMTALVESDLVAAAQQAAASTPPDAAAETPAAASPVAPSSADPGTARYDAPQAAPQGAPVAPQQPVYTAQQPPYGTQPAPKKKHTVAIVVSVVAAVLVICLVVAIVMTVRMTGRIVDAAQSFENNTTIGTTDVVSPDGDTLDTTDVGTSGRTASGVEVELSGYWLTTGADGTTPVIVIETTVTNNSKDDIVYWDAVYDEVEQNGEALSYATMDDPGYDEEGYMTTIAKGRTYTVQNAYILNDTYSEVDVYLYDWSTEGDQSLIAAGTVDVTE